MFPLMCGDGSDLLEHRTVEGKRFVTIRYRGQSVDEEACMRVRRKRRCDLGADTPVFQSGFERAPEFTRGMDHQRVIAQAREPEPLCRL